MKYRLVVLLVALALTVGVAFPAQAAVVTFSGFGDACVPSLATGGLTFTNVGSICMGPWNNNPNGNGSTGLILGFSGLAEITRTGGGAFDLNSFEMGISWYSAATATTVGLTAYFHGGGSATQTLTLVNSLQPYNLNLVGLDKVAVTAIAAADGYWLMDNVNYSNSVPDPGSSLLLLGMSLAGLRAWKKRLG